MQLICKAYKWTSVKPVPTDVEKYVRRLHGLASVIQLFSMINHQIVTAVV